MKLQELLPIPTREDNKSNIYNSELYYFYSYASAIEDRLEYAIELLETRECLLDAEHYEKCEQFINKIKEEKILVKSHE